MDVINYDQFIMGNDEGKLADKWWAPKTPARIALIGPCGSGKSNVLTHLLLRVLDYQKVYYFCRNMDEAITKYLCYEMAKTQIIFDEKKGVDSYNIFQISNDLNDLPLLEDINPDLDPNFHTIIIINDMVLAPNQNSLLGDLFLNSRHRYASMIYLSQFFFAMDKCMRDSLTHVFLFRLCDNRNIHKIHGVIGGRLSLEEFRKLYAEIIKEPYAFMLIDINTPHLCLAFRKNFNGLYKPNKD